MLNNETGCLYNDHDNLIGDCAWNVVRGHNIKKYIAGNYISYLRTVFATYVFHSLFITSCADVMNKLKNIETICPLDTLGCPECSCGINNTRC